MQPKDEPLGRQVVHVDGVGATTEILLGHGARDVGAGMTEEPAPTPVAETVLVVDDDEDVLDVAAKVLERGGYTVLTASSAQQALDSASAYGTPVALLLTDVVMPGMGGRELSERFAEVYPKVPVLFMSAYTEDEVVVQGIRLDDVKFIPKPFTVEGLREKVRATIQAARK